MFKSKLSKVIVSLLRRVLGVTRSGAKRLMRAMLRSLMAMGRRARLPVAGFVLPTVTMVLLVVILLTVAIVLRSFDRGNIARNVRVNQQVLAAATPALDRAKAKIQFMLDQSQGGGTPSDEDLYLLITKPLGGSVADDNYTFGGEERLTLKYDLNKSGSIEDLPVNTPTFNLEANESINTAWRYPVDTNNDGKFDTFTLYGIFFRTPPRDDVKDSPTVGEFLRQRQPLEARTPPMSVAELNPNCLQGGGTAASLAGDSGWYRLDGKLKKSFFVYTVNVPITEAEASANSTYQKFTGTSSISALEYQQDQSRIPIANNAVVYEDDLEISPGPPLNLNGRIFTNSNLLVSGAGSANSIKLYQVSSPESCYYEQENSKIVVAGNVVNGVSTDNATKNAVDVHLFKKDTLPGVGGRTAFILDEKLEINTSEESADNPTLDVLYNNEAYTKRLDLLVEAQMGENNTNPETNDPLLVQQRPDTQDRKQALTEYFKQLTRKVPFAEVRLVGGDATAGYGLPWADPPGTPPIEGTKDTLRPVAQWSIPNPGDTKIDLNEEKLFATNPIPEPPTEEEFLGDRVVAGNNLPALRWDGAKFINTPETVAAKWNPSDAGTTRERSPQVTTIADVGATERDGFWEGEAARYPENPLDGNGGLRVITGAGVYERKNSFLPPPSWVDSGGAIVIGDTATYDDPATNITEEFPVVWPDSMPMSPLGLGSEVYNNSVGGAFVPGNWDPLVATPPPPPPYPPGGLLPVGLPSTVPGSIDPNTRQYAKGDLRMRATVVYHYAYDFSGRPGEFNDKPLACVSSYYDPSTASTARNLSTLPDVSGTPSLGLPGTEVGSNNGITYGPPGARPPGSATVAPGNGLLSGSGDATLDAQANLVFPDGRFANKPLRDALQVADDDRTLAQKAAIDSTLCALSILGGSGPDSSVIPHGAIKEVAFLNGREIKAIDRDDWTTNVNEAFTLSSSTTGVQAAKLTGNYNLPLEEREPLEIRATQIDLNVLRTTPFGTGESLLPNSGIIYATRDDALPDRSFRPGLGGGGIDESRSETVSPTDSLLDPSRKPSGILLVNGEELGRIPSPPSPTVADVVIEKGLTLASNLPVYIKGDFNLHSHQEFDPAGDWSNFYDRTNLNKNFACRPNDPRLAGNCTTGDTWRPANVLSDSVTLLSKDYRFGFRNEGDFDLRNNAGAAAVGPRKQQGFYSNNFVTNGLSSGAFTATGGQLVNTGGTVVTDANYANNNNPINSSYFNNFVTPVQRRGAFPEYVMEVCKKIPVSACTDDDWYVNPETNARATIGQNIDDDDYLAGTTAIPPAPELQRFPRRVAFKRAGALLDLTDGPVPLGISDKTVTDGPGTNLTTANSLWFGTTATAGADTVTYGSDNFPFVFNLAQKDGSGAALPTLVSTTPADLTESSQPLLMPVLQIQTLTEAPAAASSTSLPGGTAVVTATGWIPKAVKTISNMVVGSNDTPSREIGGGVGDSNGGVQNLTRFLESWSGNIGSVIQGSFIQFNRSAYSTAPYIPILNPTAPQQVAPLTKLRSLFDTSPIPPSTPITYNGGAPLPYYRTSNASVTIGGVEVGRLPFFSPPLRDWGFDVGLLSQPPDLFTRKFTTPPSTPTPAEYFREVPRNDEWVKTLMCGVLENTTTNATETLTTAERAANCSP
jgi:type II secretory pathway pseudopilin PulG